MGRNSKVDAFLQKKKHPLTDQIQMVREIILKVNDNIQEDIKWQSPIFMYKGNMASIRMNTKKFVSVMFHKGALIGDSTGFLEGDGSEVRIARFMNGEDIMKKKKALESIVEEWVRLQDAAIA